MGAANLQIGLAGALPGVSVAMDTAAPNGLELLGNAPTPLDCYIPPPQSIIPPEKMTSAVLANALNAAGFTGRVGTPIGEKTDMLMQYLGATTANERGSLYSLLVLSQATQGELKKELAPFGLTLGENGREILTVDASSRADVVVTDKTSDSLGFPGLPEAVAAVLRENLKRVMNRSMGFFYAFDAKILPYAGQLAKINGVDPEELHRDTKEIVQNEMAALIAVLETYADFFDRIDSAGRKEFILGSVRTLLAELKKEAATLEKIEALEKPAGRLLLKHLNQMADGLQAIFYPRIYSMYWFNRVSGHLQALLLHARP